MDQIFIQSTRKTPQIILDTNKGSIEISGRSIPEDSEKTYGIVIQWLDDYLKNPKEVTTVNFYFEYINSSSTKTLVYIMNKLLVASKAKMTTTFVNWLYSDDDIFEYGKDFLEISELNFKFIKQNGQDEFEQ